MSNRVFAGAARFNQIVGLEVARGAVAQTLVCESGRHITD